jgi:hypothetical protein
MSQMDYGRPENEIRVSPLSRHLRVMKGVLLALFVLTFFCLPAGLALEAQNFTFSTETTANAWMFFLFLPIPLASLILGIIYKRKGLKTTKNIVAGVIFIILLCAYGAFTSLFSGFYSHDPSYIDSIAQEVRFPLPDRGSVTTQNMKPDSGRNAGNSSARQTSSASGDRSVNNGAEYDSLSKVELTDKKQTADFEKSLRGSKCWVTSLNTSLSSIVPMFFSVQSSDFDYYMVYNATLGTYNTVPATAGNCRYVFIAYSGKKDQMLIGEYNYAVVP